MNICPKTAKSWGVELENEAAVDDWCRRAHKKGLSRCEGCEIGARAGVVETKTDRQVMLESVPVQGRLF